MAGSNRLASARRLYLVIALAICASVFLGFSQTYLTSAQLAGTADPLPPIVHLHGVSFLAWYALLAVQALLVIRRSLALHRALGMASLALVALMIASGLIVLAVKMENGLAGDPFWGAFSLGIFSNLVLFAGFYAAGLVQRTRPEVHRRCMIAAAALGSGAAQFRTVSAFTPLGLEAVPLGLALTFGFLIAAMLGEWRITGRIPRLYLYALPAAALFELLLLAIPGTAAGTALQQMFVAIFRPLFGLY